MLFHKGLTIDSIPFTNKLGEFTWLDDLFPCALSHIILYTLPIVWRDGRLAGHFPTYVYPIQTWSTSKLNGGWTGHSKFLPHGKSRPSGSPAQRSGSESRAQSSSRSLAPTEPGSQGRRHSCAARAPVDKRSHDHRGDCVSKSSAA